MTTPNNGPSPELPPFTGRPAPIGVVRIAIEKYRLDHPDHDISWRETLEIDMRVSSGSAAVDSPDPINQEPTS